MHVSNIFCNFALSNKNNNSKTFRTMKNETKKKIAAVSAGFTLTTFIGTCLLVTFNHPAQWYIAGACMFGMIVKSVFSCSIED